MKPIRNVSFFSLNFSLDSVIPGAEKLAMTARKFSFTDLSGYEVLSFGFFPQSDFNREWLHETEAGLFFCVKFAKKKPSASFVREVFNQKLKKQKKYTEQVSRKDLKAEIERELTLRALPKISYVQVFLSKNGWLFVDSMNAEIQELIGELLSQVIPGCKVKPDLTPPTLPAIFNAHLRGQCSIPNGFDVHRDVSLITDSRRTIIIPFSSYIQVIGLQPCEIKYITIKSSRLSFRWHADGSISEIERLDRGAVEIADIQSIHHLIAEWYNHQRDYHAFEKN
jgi:DNA recombination-dependent growth factor C